MWAVAPLAYSPPPPTPSLCEYNYAVFKVYVQFPVPPPPSPSVNIIMLYSRICTVCKGGLWGFWASDRKHLPPSPFTGKFFSWHFVLLFMSLIFYGAAIQYVRYLWGSWYAPMHERTLRYRIPVYPEFNGQLISHSVAIMSLSHLPLPLNSPKEMLAKITVKRYSNFRLCSPHFTEWLIL
jgi:hypothetical protein